VDNNAVKLEVNDVYLPLLKDENRFLVLRGGAGSGKSVFLAQNAILKLVASKEPLVILVVRKVQASIKDSVFAEFVAVVRQLGLTKKLRIVKHPMEIAYGDSRIIFAGVDDVEKLKSLSRPNIIWMEEASEFGFEDFKQLNLRLRGKGIKQMWLSFNPIDDRHWLKSHFWDEKPYNATLLHTTYHNNSYLDEEYKKEVENIKNYDMNYYRIYALGEWGSTSKGLVYKKYDVYKNLPSEGIIDYVYGLDFGFNHPMAMVKVYFTEDDIYVSEVIYDKGLTVDGVINRLPKAGVKYSDIIYADSANPDDIQKLRVARYNIAKANKDLEAGIDSVRSYNIHIHEDSHNLINELGLYKYKEHKGLSKDDVFKDEVVKLFDDGLDAMRYAVHTHRAKGVPFLW